MAQPEPGLKMDLLHFELERMHLDNNNEFGISNIGKNMIIREHMIN